MVPRRALQERLKGLCQLAGRVAGARCPRRHCRHRGRMGGEIGNAVGLFVGLLFRLPPWRYYFLVFLTFVAALFMSGVSVQLKHTHTRVTAGQAEATAERRLKELETLLKEASSDRSRLQQEVESVSESLAERLASQEVSQGNTEEILPSWCWNVWNGNVSRCTFLCCASVLCVGACLLEKAALGHGAVHNTI